MKSFFGPYQNAGPYLFWIGYWLIWILMLSNFQEFDKAIISATANIGIQAAAAHININMLLPEFFEQKRYVMYTFLVIVLLFVLAKLHLSVIDPELKIPSLRRIVRYPKLFQFGRIYLFLLIVILISTAYKFAGDRFKTLQRETEMARQKTEIELVALKNQINPHFLFNTLNNIYTLAYLKDDNAAAMIMKLSELLRYMLYECVQEKVALEKEVMFLQNLVEMQKLKSPSHEKGIHFTVNGIRPGQTIAPLLLLSFIENSFKYADLDLNPAGFIRISISIDGHDQMHFRCINTKQKNAKQQPERHGIGLENLKKRLELIYGTHHELNIGESTAEYQVGLKLSVL